MNWYKIRYTNEDFGLQDLFYLEIFKATDPDELRDKWDKFKKDHNWILQDVELLERGKSEFDKEARLRHLDFLFDAGTGVNSGIKEPPVDKVSPTENQENA
jgi:hypothetical protein